MSEPCEKCGIQQGCMSPQILLVRWNMSYERRRGRLCGGRSTADVMTNLHPLNRNISKEEI